MARLKAAHWKGNARELENVIERALALCDSPEIGSADLPLEPLGASAPEETATSLIGNAVDRCLTLRELEKLYIDQIMKRTGGNKVQAARILGIDRKTLYRRAARDAQAGS
jgi:DNA-binding NtrC family response regulator